MIAAFATNSPLYLYPLIAGSALCLLQIVFYFVGHVAISDHIGEALGSTPLGDAFDWLNLGRVPFALVLMLLLVTFGTVGVALTGLIPSLPDWMFSLVAAPAAVMVTKTVGDKIARLLPREETYAVTSDEFVGLEGTVTLGPLDDGFAGNVVVRDRHGETHVLRAKPVDGGTVIELGSRVVVVARDESHKGRVFLVMPFPV